MSGKPVSREGLRNKEREGKIVENLLNESDMEKRIDGMIDLTNYMLNEIGISQKALSQKKEESSVFIMCKTHLSFCKQVKRERLKPLAKSGNQIAKNAKAAFSNINAYEPEVKTTTFVWTQEMKDLITEKNVPLEEMTTAQRADILAGINSGRSAAGEMVTMNQLNNKIFKMWKRDPLRKKGDKKKRKRNGNSTKSPKDPKVPKRPLSAWMHFCNARRAEVRKANPTLSLPEVTKVLGKQWKALDESSKAPFVRDANAGKARHKAEKQETAPSPNLTTSAHL